MFLFLRTSFLTVYIIGHRRMNPIDFGECRNVVSFTGVQKIILMQYDLRSHIILKVWCLDGSFK